MIGAIEFQNSGELPTIILDLEQQGCVVREIQYHTDGCRVIYSDMAPAVNLPRLEEYLIGLER